MSRLRRTLAAGLLAGALSVVAVAGASAGSIPTGYYPDDPYLIVGPGERLPGGNYDPLNPPAFPPLPEPPVIPPPPPPGPTPVDCDSIPWWQQCYTPGVPTFKR